MRTPNLRRALIAACACVLLVLATAQATSTKAEIEASVEKGVTDRKTLQLTSGGFASDWDLGALAAGRVAAANVKKSGAGTDARTWYRELVGNETATKWPAKAISTEYQRAALNAYAAGIEPARVSKTQNLIAGILSFYQPEHPGYYGEPTVFEGTVFGLLALADAKTEEGAQGESQALLEQSIATIEANEAPRTAAGTTRRPKATKRCANPKRNPTRRARRLPLCAPPASLPQPTNPSKKGSRI